MNGVIPQVVSFPLGGVDEQGRLAFARDDQSLRDVMRNILLTSPGERLMRPEFGAGLLDFIHQANNETTRTLIASLVRKAIEQWETRVVVKDVSVLPDSQNISQVQIVIHYQLRHIPEPLQLTLGMNLSSL